MARIDWPDDDPTAAEFNQQQIEWHRLEVLEKEELIELLERSMNLLARSLKMLREARDER